MVLAAGRFFVAAILVTEAFLTFGDVDVITTVFLVSAGRRLFDAVCPCEGMAADLDLVILVL